MENDLLNLANYQDLKNPKERLLYRCLETVPALLSWGTLFFIVFFSYVCPLIIATFAIIFACFWFLRVVYLGCHQISGYRKMRSNLKTNWFKKIKEIEGWQNIYHLVVLPMYKEEIEVVRSTFQSLTRAAYPKDKMIVLLTVEERGGEEGKRTAEMIKKEFAQSFFKLLVVYHPQNIIGEIAAKGANVNWAVKKLQKDYFFSEKDLIINQIVIPYKNIIASNFDVDTKPYQQYFAILTWHYLRLKDSLRCSFQPIPIYNNNVWQVPAFSRVIATSGTFWQTMQQERPEQLVSYSSHSIPFQTLIEVGYPHNVVSDDSRIFWKSYLKYQGNFKVVPLYYPVSMDAVMAENLFQTAINQYKQQRRWGWGCENIPYLLYNFLKNKKIPLKEKLRHTFVILEGFWSWAVAALLIFFLGWFPLIVGGKEFKTTLFSYKLPKITSFIMTLAMVGMVVSAILSLSLLPPKPKGLGRGKKVSILLQWLLLPVTLIIFGSFPALEAQARLALGKYMGFWVTEKVRK